VQIFYDLEGKKGEKYLLLLFADWRLRESWPFRHIEKRVIFLD